MTGPRLTILIPTRNAAATLRRALDSLAAQNYAALEVIVIDAESTDGTPGILADYAALVSRVVREPDSGPAHALNKGLALASGEILGWLGADDELLPGALAEAAAQFAAHPEAEIVIGSCERVFEDGSTALTPACPGAWRIIGRRNVIDQPAAFWKRSVQERVGPLDESYGLAFDWDLWCRMARAAARLVTTDATLARYHFTPASKSNTAGDGHARESFRILRRYGPLGGGLAYVYRFLYEAFDRHGCYDQPPACGPGRARVFALTRLVLRVVLGGELIEGYNWHFASRQARGLKWW